MTSFLRSCPSPPGRRCSALVISRLCALLFAGTACMALAQTHSNSEEIDLDLLAYLEQDVLEEHGFTDSFEAEVWYESMFPRLQAFEIADQEKIQILQSVHAESRASGLSPNLILAVIEVESSFDRYAISRAGAQGLMQVMTFWKKELGRPEDNLTDPYTNLKYGTSILSYYLEMSQGDTTEALSRYNGSYPQTWYAERVYRAMDKWQH